MWRSVLFIVAVGGFTMLVTPGQAAAWGAAHVGYTHVGPGGVQHYGATEVRGPYGAYGGAHVGGVGYGGAYHAGYGGGVGYGGAYHYGYGGAAVGGYHYGAVSAGGVGTVGGVYRRW